ncbi:MAG: 2Fe-2S iron-sulfur cluster binding domain-containing protein [Arenicellales bacterium]
MPTVTFLNKQGRVTVECKEGETLLQAGLRQGVPLPYGCGAGICSTCVARARPGTVEECWSEAPGAQNLKRDKGECLLCQSRISQDCEILVPGKIDLAVTSEHKPDHYCARLHDFNVVAPEVATFQLSLEGKVDYLAGQYFLVKLEGMQGYRPYSMTDFQRKAQSLSFVIKRISGGKFSEQLFTIGAPDSAVEVFGPMGLATFDPSEARDLVCLVGGSGIAGIMSVLDQAVAIDYFERHRLFLVFGVRRQDDFFFLDELKRVRDSAPDNVTIHLAISEEEMVGSSESQFDGSPLHQGFVHEVAEQLGEGLFENHLAFLGGPPAMLTGSLALLLGAGLPVSDIRYDRFG